MLERGDLIISSNLAVRLDGLPRSGQSEPADPGVAVYWLRPGESQRCMAIDLYDRVADNLAAIAATLEALRAIERHGGAQILDRAFTGFTALSGPVVGARPWREILGLQPVDKARPVVEGAYKRLRMSTHPDHGGTPAAFQAVTAAWEQACRELGW